MAGGPSECVLGARGGCCFVVVRNGRLRSGRIAWNSVRASADSRSGRIGSLSVVLPHSCELFSGTPAWIFKRGDRCGDKTWSSGGRVARRIVDPARRVARVFHFAGDRRIDVGGGVDGVEAELPSA